MPILSTHRRHKVGCGISSPLVVDNLYDYDLFYGADPGVNELSHILDDYTYSSHHERCSLGGNFDFLSCSPVYLWELLSRGNITLAQVVLP